MEWEFEPGHSAAEFRCRHMMVTWVRGHFKNVSGRLSFDPDDPAGGSVETEIDASTVWSGESDRDDHLRHADFLDIENHPTIRFRSRRVEVCSETEWRVTGDLTLRGVTKPVDLDVRYLGQWETPFWVGDEDQGPMLRAGFVASAVIDRRDFGVSWNSDLPDGGVVVGREVRIELDVEALRKKT